MICLEAILGIGGIKKKKSASLAIIEFDLARGVLRPRTFLPPLVKHN